MELSLIAQRQMGVVLCPDVLERCWEKLLCYQTVAAYVMAVF